MSVAAFSKHSRLRAHHAIMALVGCSPGGCIDTSLTQSDTAKKEPELDPVWDQFERGPEYKQTRRYKASCLHCPKVFNDGRLEYLKRHITNECTEVPAHIKLELVQRLAQQS